MASPAAISEGGGHIRISLISFEIDSISKELLHEI